MKLASTILISALIFASDVNAEVNEVIELNNVVQAEVATNQKQDLVVTCSPKTKQQQDEPNECQQEESTSILGWGWELLPIVNLIVDLIF